MTLFDFIDKHYIVAIILLAIVCQTVATIFEIIFSRYKNK